MKFGFHFGRTRFGSHQIAGAADWPAGAYDVSVRGGWKRILWDDGRITYSWRGVRVPWFVWAMLSP